MVQKVIDNIRNFKKWLGNSKWRQIGFAVLVIILILILSFLGWALNPRGPMDEAREALDSDDEVEVIEDDKYVFEPKDDEVNTGFILYPGARVDPRSYAPLAREIAREGFLVVIEPMRLNLAIFSSDAAKETMTEFQDIENWVIGGHSLGGAMASRFVRNEGADGLILWASYPDDDISHLDIPVISIYGSEDGLSTVEDVENSASELPEGTEWVKIEGGNHAQFGWYGSQRGDNEAEISREEQQKIIVENTTAFLKEI